MNSSSMRMRSLILVLMRLMIHLQQQRVQMVKTFIIGGTQVLTLVGTAVRVHLLLLRLSMVVFNLLISQIAGVIIHLLQELRYHLHPQAVLLVLLPQIFVVVLLFALVLQIPEIKLQVLYKVSI